jgi:hypothetical protein
VGRTELAHDWVHRLALVNTVERLFAAQRHCVMYRASCFSQMRDKESDVI